MGEIHPSTLKKIDLEAPVFFAEVHLEELIHDLKRELKMEALPLYPPLHAIGLSLSQNLPRSAPCLS